MAPRAGNFLWVILVFTVTSMYMNMLGYSAEQHVVGDERGWDPLSDFKGWASRKIFRVGDNLWFAYASSQHNVLELKSPEEFENCDVSNPIKLFNGGLDAVPLVEVGERFFTSGNVEACQSGMKVHINVVSDGVLNNGQSDNLEGASDGLDRVRKDWGSGLLSDGVEKEKDSFILRSDGMDNSTAASMKRKKPLMEATAEGPTSGTLGLSPSSIINLALSFCGTFITILYAMV